MLLVVGTCLLAAACTTPRSPATPRTVSYPTLSSEQAGDIAIHALGLVGTP